MNEQQVNSWAVGWSIFASVLLMMAGTFQVIAALAALIEDEFYVVTTNWVFNFDVTTWGWIHLLIGVVLILSGLGVLTGNVAARAVGVGIAAVSAVANFAFLPYYPVWALTVIAIDVAVIWALTAHGRDVAAV